MKDIPVPEETNKTPSNDDKDQVPEAVPVAKPTDPPPEPPKTVENPLKDMLDPPKKPVSVKKQEAPPAPVPPPKDE